MAYPFQSGRLRAAAAALCAAALCGAVGASAARAGVEYTITPITTPNAADITAAGLNNGGQVVGFYSQRIGPSVSPHHGFRWSAATGLQDMGTLGGEYAAVRDVNDSGWMVGHTTITSDTQAM